MPKEVLQCIAGFIERPQSGAMFNALGKVVPVEGYSKCVLCRRMMLEEDVYWVEGQCMCFGAACTICERMFYRFHRADPVSYDDDELPEGLVPREGSDYEWLDEDEDDEDEDDEED